MYLSRELARVDDVLRPLVAAELLDREAKTLRDELLDPLDRDLRHLALGKDVLEHVLGEVLAHRTAGERREGNDPRERALELADVRGDAAGDELQHLRVRDG